MLRITWFPQRIIMWALVVLLLLGSSSWAYIEQAAASQGYSETTEQTNSNTVNDAAGDLSEETNTEPEKPQRELYEEALVLDIEDIESVETEDSDSVIKEQKVKVRVLSGVYAGKELVVVNELLGSTGIDIHVETGDRVIICLTLESGANGKEYIRSANLSDRLRSPALVWLGLLFAGLILVLGRLQGLKALLGLGATALGIYLILLPGLMAGKNALPLTIMVLIGVTLVTMVFVAGFSRKCLAATLGTLGGLVIAGLVAYFFGDWAHLSGLSTEEERMLLYIDIGNVKIDMKGLLFSGILIGALGAVMDVAMSVASTISEVKKADPGMKTLQLMSAGMNVGRDIMGTMANTLILAYTGSALPLMLLFMAYKMEPIRIVNWEMIATEIVRALVGSIALIACIPITAFITGWLYNSTESAKISPSRTRDQL
ncbi:MAG: YibE/F family protein [Syntrophomonadaceae bacterium]|nr:YibE/F family protein [Syntrophomonadaceae bacterium]